MANDTLSFYLSDWSVISITGPDRKSYLHSFCTNDINKLVENESCEAFIPNEKGRVLGHVFVVNGTEQLTLVSTPNANQTLGPHLQKYLLGVDAEIVDQTTSSAVIAVVGDQAAEVLGLSEALEWHRSTTMPVNAATCTVSREAMMKQPTYLVTGPEETILELQRQLVEQGVLEGTTEQLERSRIEAGFPYVGIDLSDKNIVQESARVKLTTSFTKGCYLGQEPIARLDAMGHTNKELRGFRIESDKLAPGAKILAEEKEVGELTSVSKVSDGYSIGLGIVRIKHAEPGTQVAIVTETGTHPAEIYWEHE